jgi:hypothetical protein
MTDFRKELNAPGMEGPCDGRQVLECGRASAAFGTRAVRNSRSVADTPSKAELSFHTPKR